MSVVSAIICKTCTAHASDSFLTSRQADGVYDVVESKKTKIVRVPAWRGALAYWGFASDPKNWSTLGWLRDQANKADAFSCAETFANTLAGALTKELSKLHVTGLTGGIGIHFTAYESIDGYRIPELFLISNWADTTYEKLRPEGIGVSRETFHLISTEPPMEDHRQSYYRHKVREFLEGGKILGYNNGDPRLYNSAANGVFTMLQELIQRNLVKKDSMEVWGAMARLPVELVSKAQRDFCKKGKRVVGGRQHDLTVTPGGEYLSTSGD